MPPNQPRFRRLLAAATAVALGLGTLTVPTAQAAPDLYGFCTTFQAVGDQMTALQADITAKKDGMNSDFEGIIADLEQLQALTNQMLAYEPPASINSILVEANQFYADMLQYLRWGPAYYGQANKLSESDATKALMQKLGRLGDLTKYECVGAPVVSEPSVTFTKAKGSATVTITAKNGFIITVPKDATWLTVSPTTTNSSSQVSVTLTVTKNTAKAARSATLTITGLGPDASAYPVQFPVTQEGKDGGLIGNILSAMAKLIANLVTGVVKLVW